MTEFGIMIDHQSVEIPFFLMRLKRHTLNYMEESTGSSVILSIYSRINGILRSPKHV